MKADPERYWSTVKLYLEAVESEQAASSTRVVDG
jgi:hypothetical protein